MHAIAEFSDIKDGKLVRKNPVNITSEITLSIYRQPKIIAYHYFIYNKIRHINVIYNNDIQ